MKKGIFFAALLGTYAAFAADCPPAESLDFEGIHLGADKESVLKIFPDAEVNQDSSSVSPEIDPDTFSKRLKGYNYGYFNLDKQGNVNEIYLKHSIDFTSTPINKLRDDIIKRFNLPLDKWTTKPLFDKKTIKSMGYNKNSKTSILVCKDYSVKITQDFGEGRGTLGPRLQIYRNSVDVSTE
jgi:hypothetical protein